MKCVILSEVYIPKDGSFRLYGYNVDANLEKAVKLAMEFIDKVDNLNRIMVLPECEVNVLGLCRKLHICINMIVGDTCYKCVLYQFKEIVVQDTVPFFFSYGKHYLTLDAATYFFIIKYPHTNVINFFTNEDEMNDSFERSLPFWAEKYQNVEVIKAKVNKLCLTQTFGEITSGFYTLEEIEKYKEFCKKFGEIRCFKFSNE